MRGGGGQRTSAQKIMDGVHRAGHLFKMDSITEGDGNCFPRAVKQQCQRLAVGILSIKDHKDLRKKVTQYMLKSKDKVVVDMRKRWTELEVRWSWESYWQWMAEDGVWVEEVFIWATAWFLNRDIWIVWDTASPQAPITFFSGDKEETGNACPGVPLIIGHHTDTHYQSLLPEGDPVGDSFDTRRYAVEVYKTLEKVRDSHQRKSRPKRKDAPEVGSEDVQDEDITILDYGPGKPGVEAKKMQDGTVQYHCLLCKEQQKQIASHMEKKHAHMFQNRELEELQASIVRFARALKKKRMREKDPEGAKKAKRESESRRYGKRKAENPDAVRKSIKRMNDAQRANGQRKFKEEQKYGHIFPCACCHTLKCRDQVVELNPQQVDKIEGKAQDHHQTLQVNSFIHNVYMYIYI